MRDHVLRPLILLLALAAAGCTSYRSYRDAEIAMQLGRWDDAVLAYMKAVESDPENITYKADLLRAKIRASQDHFEKGKRFKKAGVFDRALVEYQQAVQLDPTNQYAQAELEGTRKAIVAQRQNRDVASIDQMKQKARGARPQPPLLNPRSNQPISLEFPQPVSIFDIYRALGKAYGINVLFDPNLKDQEIAIELKDVTAKDALEVLMRAAGHFYKVMDEQTVLIAADTPQNRRTYEDLVIQTFFLSNAEVKDMMTILRSLVDAKKIATNEQLNAIILRDTADKVKVAERIIEANDKSKAEVVVDVELLQINTGRLRDLGVALSPYSVTQSLDLGSDDAKLRVSDLEFLNQSNWVLTIPNFIYNFIKTNSDAQLLAKPQLRITEGEKASLVIGDRVPIPLTTFNTSNTTVGGTIVPITSFQYQDVGIRIDMEPRVHHNQEVTLKVKVEVSNLNGEVRGSGGQSQPIIGTRTIDSTIRLQDGETNFMAGLIRSDETSSESGVPGLSEIPVLGRLFSSKSNQNQRTDVILTITPHIIRNAEITEDDLLPIWVGTEANISFRGGSPRVESDVEGPFEGNEGTPEEIQDAIRRRLQRLPRGLRPGEGGDEEEQQEQPQAQPPAGIDLAPATPPNDIFRKPQPAPDEQPVEEEPPGSAALGPAAGDLVAASLVGNGDRLLVARRAAGSGTRAPVARAAAVAATAAPEAPNSASGVEAGGDPAVRLSLVPQRLQVAPGDRFQVSIQATALSPVSHLPLTLAFDPAVLAVERTEAGDFLGAAGAAQVLGDSTRPGQLVIGASQLGRGSGVAGSGTLARITFRALAAGTTTLSFAQKKALDPALRPLAPVAARPAEVVVDGEAEPREPHDRGDGRDRPQPPVAGNPARRGGVLD